MLEELENTARLMRQNADSVESKSLDKLNSLYAEKRRARKQYQEEHNRIVAQFTHVSLQFLLLLIIYKSIVQNCLSQAYFSLPSHVDQLWGLPILLSSGYCGLTFWGLKLLRHEADLLPVSKNLWNSTSTSVYLYGVILN
jgi:tyrosine-protein kinase Fer